MKKRLERILAVFLAVVMMLGNTPYLPGAVKSMAAYENTYTNTGNQRADIIGVAKTQLGYTEGANNDTKYGSWYGLPNQPWCAMFISWCARQAGIPISVIPNISYVPNYYNTSVFQVRTSNYIPQPGDIFFTKSESHVGLVLSVEGSYFYTIEGNSNTNGSDDGVAVVSNRRLISNFYYAVPNYSSVTHTRDTSYGTNFTAYPKRKIVASEIFYANHTQYSSGAWIGTSDSCTIHEVYTDGCCKVSYPGDGGRTVTMYSKIALFNIPHTHSYSSSVTKSPTCTSTGTRTYTCSCGNSYTESIPVLVHSYSTKYTLDVIPTCTENGFESRYCTRSGCTAKTDTRILAPTGHRDYDNNGVCDICKIKISEKAEENDPAKACSCNCHKSGFMGFIWKILLVFYRIFGTNKVCLCGVIHY